MSTAKTIEELKKEKETLDKALLAEEKLIKERKDKAELKKQSEIDKQNEAAKTTMQKEIDDLKTKLGNIETIQTDAQKIVEEKDRQALLKKLGNKQLAEEYKDMPLKTLKVTVDAHLKERNPFVDPIKDKKKDAEPVKIKHYYDNMNGEWIYYD